MYLNQFQYLWMIETQNAILSPWKAATLWNAFRLHFVVKSSIYKQVRIFSRAKWLENVVHKCLYIFLVSWPYYSFLNCWSSPSSSRRVSPRQTPMIHLLEGGLPSFIKIVFFIKCFDLNFIYVQMSSTWLDWFRGGLLSI